MHVRTLIINPTKKKVNDFLGPLKIVCPINLSLFKLAALTMYTLSFENTIIHVLIKIATKY